MEHGPLNWFPAFHLWYSSWEITWAYAIFTASTFHDLMYFSAIDDRDFGVFGFPSTDDPSPNLEDAMATS